MDSKTNEGFEKVAVLLAQMDSRLMALQVMVEGVGGFTDDQKASFRADLKSYADIFFRRKMEYAEDIDPTLATRLFHEGRSKPKNPEGEE